MVAIPVDPSLYHVHVLSSRADRRPKTEVLLIIRRLIASVLLMLLLDRALCS